MKTSIVKTLVNCVELELANRNSNFSFLFSSSFFHYFAELHSDPDYRVEYYEASRHYRDDGSSFFIVNIHGTVKGKPIEWQISGSYLDV